MRTVVALFDTIVEAKQTLEELVQYGLDTRTISIVTTPGEGHTLEWMSRPGPRAWDASGSLNPLREIDLADVGAVAVFGPLREAMSGPDGTGSLTKALQRLGLSGDIAARYTAGVRQGETLESVVVENWCARDVVGIMQRRSHPGRVPSRPPAR